MDARNTTMRADTKEPASFDEAGSGMSAREEENVRRTPLRLEAMALAALAASTWFVLALDNSVDPLFSRNLITVFFTVNRCTQFFSWAMSPRPAAAVAMRAGTSANDRHACARHHRVQQKPTLKTSLFAKTFRCRACTFANIIASTGLRDARTATASSAPKFFRRQRFFCTAGRVLREKFSGDAASLRHPTRKWPPGGGHRIARG
ncbi:hypothetical protein [Solilutibacter oculi]|uniref:hypothetical protein n=1 Tax=Solilutibacter oculi TaxID=2698682 RepID=UPI0013A66830|nr:hypothetical protein [Lysobacter oculi]